MKLIRKENGDYHILVNDEIKSLQDFNITKEDCDILTLGYSVERMARVHRVNLKQDWSESSYLVGFNAHKELVKDKMFTIEDMEAACAFGVALGKHKSNLSYSDEFKGFMKERGKTEWQVTFDEQGKFKLI